MHTVSRKRRTMAVLAVVVLVAVAGAGMAYGAAIIVAAYDFDLPPLGRTVFSEPVQKRATHINAEDKNDFIARRLLWTWPTEVRTRVVRNDLERTLATDTRLITSGVDMLLPYRRGEAVRWRSFRLAQDIPLLEGCQVRTTESRGRWSPDNF